MFCDPFPVLGAFLNTYCDMTVMKEWRIKLILLWHFLVLFYCFDWAMVLRQFSSVESRLFVAVKLKGGLSWRREEVLMLRDSIWCPGESLLSYVKLTSSLVVLGKRLLTTLHHPYTPLASNAIGSLTAAEVESRFGWDAWPLNEILRCLRLPNEMVGPLDSGRICRRLESTIFVWVLWVRLNKN